MNLQSNDIAALVSYLSDFVTAERLEKFQDNIEKRTKHITVVLEDIFQSHNISAVLRSCECFGVQDVHVIDKNDFFEINSEIELGSSKWLSIKHYNKKKKNNTINCLQSLKNEGYKIIATTPHIDDYNLDDIDINDKTALVFGTELQGLSDEAKAMADAYMKIPMYGFTESFNISVTVALCIHYLTKKIRESSVKWQLSQDEKNEVLLQWFEKSIKNSEMIIERFHENSKLDNFIE
ncbi:MAG: TrmH family RNA methyltransferase [Bacteroidota bacterium]